MNVYWLEQAEADVPSGNDWLHAGELDRLNHMRFAKRRADWRLGRWTAKHAVAFCLHLPLDRRSLTAIEIRSRHRPARLTSLSRTGQPVQPSHLAIAPAGRSAW